MQAQLRTRSSNQISDGNEAAIEAGVAASAGVDECRAANFVVCNIQIHCRQLCRQHIGHVCRIGVEQEAIQRCFILRKGSCEILIGASGCAQTQIG